MSYAEMKTTEFKLTLIAEHAKRDKSMKFTSLAHIFSKMVSIALTEIRLLE